MGTINLAHKAVIIPAPNTLFVLTSSGMATLRSPGLDELHVRIAPFLNGTKTRESLFAAVEDAMRPMVTKYLGALQQAGAIRLSDDSHIDECAPVIAFVTPHTAWRKMLTIDQWLNQAARRGYVVVASSTLPHHVPPEDVAGSYGRWLSAIMSSQRTRLGAAHFFILDPATGALRLTLLVESSSRSHLREIADKLKVISPADVDQIPLTILTANHQFHPFPVTMCGIWANQNLYDELLCTFLKRSLLATESALNKLTTLTNPLNSRTKWIATEERDIAAFANRCMKTAFSNLSLRMALLEEFAAANRTKPLLQCPTDLIRSESVHRDVRYLITVLKARVATIPALLTKTSEGLFVYDVGDRRYFSFIQEKALRDALLGTTSELFYASNAASIQEIGLRYDFASFENVSQIREVLRERENDLHSIHPHAVYRLCKFVCWGRTFWGGMIE